MNTTVQTKIGSKFSGLLIALAISFVSGLWYEYLELMILIGFGVVEFE